MKATRWLVGTLLALWSPGRPQGTETIPVLLEKTDYLCILRTWRIRGVRVCIRERGPHACLIVENAYPCGILEVVRKPGTSQLAEMGAILPRIPLPATSSHTGTLQFAEARVYTYVPPFPLATALPLAVPVGPLFEIDYVSEADPLAWRIDWLDRFLLPGCADYAGAWGSYSPRTGFVDGSNEVVASYLAAMRAGRAANRPSGRVVFGPYPFEPRTGHYVQPVAPKWRTCLPIGAPPDLVEKGALSMKGEYLLIHFGIFEACHGCDPVTLAPAREVP